MVVMLTAASVLFITQPPLPASPPPQGQHIEARDGDTVIVRDDARVRVVYRRDARVRAVYNASQHWLILLVDYAKNGSPDGGVDVSYSFNGLEGEWPLGERWEGSAVIDDYAAPGQPGFGSGVGITTTAGYVQILRPNDRWRDERATALSASGFGRGGGGNRPFDEVESVQATVAAKNYERNVSLPPRYVVETGMAADAMGAAPSPAPGEQPVRVGGNIAAPQRIQYVPPVLPDGARQAGLSGVVILEIVVGVDGSVTSAKILRSIPMLDQAALEAVRQWRYTPTLLNGRPVPVVMTVTANVQP